MPPADKAKAAGISASSFFDLKAELSKKEAEFSKNKAAGKANAVVGGVKRDNKVCTAQKARVSPIAYPLRLPQKLSQWAKANAGVQARATRDIDLGEISKPTLESARAILERKAKVYDKLRKGKSGGLDDKQYDALLVDVSTGFAVSEHAGAYAFRRPVRAEGYRPIL